MITSVNGVCGKYGGDLTGHWLAFFTVEFQQNFEFFFLLISGKAILLIDGCVDFFHRGLAYSPS